jgi:hypothetical protein
MTESDGSGEWRNIEAAELGQIMQQRLSKMQNPTNCRSAKKIHCNYFVSGIGKLYQGGQKSTDFKPLGKNC